MRKFSFELFRAMNEACYFQNYTLLQMNRDVSLKLLSFSVALHHNFIHTITNSHF